MIFETLKWRLKCPEEFSTASLDITRFFLFVRYFLFTTLSLQPARHGLLNQGHAERTDFPISTLPSCLHTCVSKNASSMQSLLCCFTCCCSVAQVVVLWVSQPFQWFLPLKQTRIETIRSLCWERKINDCILRRA